MKKWMIFVLICVLALAFIGCGKKTETAVPVVIAEDVTQIDVTCYHCGGRTTWSLDEGEIFRLRQWAEELKFERIEPEKGDAPSDKNGGTTFRFILTGGDLEEFYYYDGGAEQHILCDEQWYVVLSPSELPIHVPEA